MDALNKILEMVGVTDLSPLSMMALCVGAFLLLGGGKLDYAGMLMYVKGLLPKAVAAKPAASAGTADARLAAAHLIRSHLKAVGAPKESLDAFNTFIAPYVWDEPANG